jgi:hypothetical protein
MWAVEEEDWDKEEEDPKVSRKWKMTHGEEEGGKRRERSEGGRGRERGRGGRGGKRSGDRLTTLLQVTDGADGADGCWYSCSY